MNESEESNTLVIGLTGGIGSGKSVVALIISNMGYPVISTDEKAKEIMVSDDAVKNKLIMEFGSEVFLPGRKLNNEYLANLVFGPTKTHKKALEKLNSIVHPPVIDYMMAEVEKHEMAGKPMVFVESALIYEAELDEGFDYVITVHSSEENRLERAMKRTGMSKEQVKARMNEQFTQDEKRKLADFVIENNGTIKELKKSVEFVVDLLKLMPNKSEEEE
ncbi:MAG: dephospho-CoA kinase [FCB group bacterium]|jgi:dephospho-CoA kinase